MKNHCILIVGLILTVTVDATAAQENEGPDHVFYSGRSVKLCPPPSWHVVEIPVGREVRLSLTPEIPNHLPAVPRDGIWLCMHARSEADQLNHDHLTDLLASRLQHNLKNDSLQLGPLEHRLRGARIEVRQSFAVELEKRNGERQDLSGVHTLIRMKNSVLEMHGIWSQHESASRMRQFAAVDQSLDLQDVQRDLPHVAQHVFDAREIVGSWKSFRSRLWLEANGRIVIQRDYARRARVDEGSPVSDKGPLIGDLVSQGDLLFVTWRDGSKLNYRWRLQGDALLLTDHKGRVSQLRRILE